MEVSSLPTWARWSIALAIMLSPVLAFLLAIVVEVVIGALMDAGVPVLLPLVLAGGLTWFVLRVRSSRPRGKS